MKSKKSVTGSNEATDELDMVQYIQGVFLKLLWSE